MGVVHPKSSLALSRSSSLGEPLASLGCETRVDFFRHSRMALRYGIFIRSDCWQMRRLIAHECVHTAQYERLGGIGQFLGCYLRECLEVGYPSGPLEQEAFLKSQQIGR
jgi:hypothetical protein